MKTTTSPGGTKWLWRRARRGGSRRLVRFYNARLAPRLDRVPLAPRVPRFFIELTNHCNLMCNMCPRPTLRRELGHMDFDLYCRLIDKIAGLGGWYVGLNRFGESLLYPRFVDAVRYAKQQGIQRVAVVTNGTRLEEGLAGEILDSGLDLLAISLDSLDREAYEQTRRGAKLDQVVGNVDRILEMRRQRGARRPQIVINSVLVDEDLDRIRALFERYNDQVDRIDLKPCARYEEGQELPGAGVARRRWRTCTQPWERLNVFWNGDATVCCGDIEGELVVGNVETASLDQLWLKNERVREIRRIHHRHEFERLPVCRRCDASNLDFFEGAIEQLKRVYGALGLGYRVVGLDNTTPLTERSAAQDAASGDGGRKATISADDLEP